MFDRSKPHVSFVVSTTDLDMSGFQQMSGLGIETEVVEHQDPNDLLTRKRPGRVKYGNITLQRAYNGATDVQRWTSEAANGKVQPRTISVEMYDRTAALVRTFTLQDCFPASWKLATDDNGFVVERLALAVDTMVTE